MTAEELIKLLDKAVNLLEEDNKRLSRESRERQKEHMKRLSQINKEDR